MKARRQFIQKLAGITALFTLSRPGKALTGSLPASWISKELEGNFIHVVFFWLKDEETSTMEMFLRELNKFIDGVEVIKSKHIGTPADTDREVIDNTYSICLIVTFDSKEEHDIYQAHQLHQDFIANASELWDKVLVYDTVK